MAYAPGPMSGRTHNVEDAPRALARVQALVDRPVRVAALGLVIAIGIVLTLGFARGTGISGFVHAAPPYTDPADAPDSLNVLPPGHGFDGQFFYRVAVAPYSKADQVAGVTFDLPTLRQQRIGYPLLASAVSLGGRDRVPFALIVVNLGALFALGWLGAKLALDSGRIPAWGLLVAAYPGFVYSLGFDTSEIVTATFLIATLLAIRRERTGLAILAVAAAVLTRETALILPMALVFAGAWPWWRVPDRTDRRIALTVGLAGIGVFVSWELWLRWSWGSFALDRLGQSQRRLPAVRSGGSDRPVPPTDQPGGRTARHLTRLPRADDRARGDDAREIAGTTAREGRVRAGGRAAAVAQRGDLDRGHLVHAGVHRGVRLLCRRPDGLPDPRRSRRRVGDGRGRERDHRRGGRESGVVGATV